MNEKVSKERNGYEAKRNNDIMENMFDAFAQISRKPVYCARLNTNKPRKRSVNRQKIKKRLNIAKRIKTIFKKYSKYK